LDQFRALSGADIYPACVAAIVMPRARMVGYHVAALVERLMRDRPHPEQGYHSAWGC